VTGQQAPTVTIRRARAEEGELLRGIAVAAKGHWDYDLDFVRRWGARMDFSRPAVVENEIYVAEVGGNVIAWAALVARHDVWWLDDLWVAPAAMGEGVGRRLFEHIADRARALGGPTRMEWQAEPNSVGFYEKVGGRYVRDSEPTSWGRVLPIMAVDL
jgi:GNAT superfamily N-acetyltransferase